MSVTSIVGPVLMTGLFSYFTGKHTIVYLPGAPFIMGAMLTVTSIVLAQKTLASLSHYHPSSHAVNVEIPVEIAEVEEADVI